MQEILDVIAVISNPARFARRYQLYREFEAYMLQHRNVRLHTVELAYGDRPHEVTDGNNPRHVQVRTDEELWHKENLFNIGMQILPKDAEYVAMIDADVRFMRPDWVEESIHQLQHYPVIQLFSHLNRLGPNYEPEMYFAESFARAWQKSQPSFDPNIKSNSLAFGNYGGLACATGLAWGYRREVLEKMGGLMDMCIIGSADYHMAAGFVGQADQSVPLDSCDPYRKMILDWEANAWPLVRGHVGYVDGLVVHYWHGKIKDRRYNERWSIVKEFDPNKHLQRDWRNRGLLKLTEAGRHDTMLLQHLREYARLRNEDSIDL